MKKLFCSILCLRTSVGGMVACNSGDVTVKSSGPQEIVASLDENVVVTQFGTALLSTSFLWKRLRRVRRSMKRFMATTEKI